MAVLLDISGLEALFKMNYESLCSTSYRLVQDKEIAAFIVQDVFTRLWKERASLKLSDTVQKYLYQRTIIQSLAYTAKLGHGTAQVKVEDYSHERYPEVELLKDVRRSVDQTINTIPEPSRSIYILARYEHLKFEDIASLLNLNTATVEAQMSAALLKLRRLINK